MPIAVDPVTSNVKVVVRVRPLTSKEHLESSQYCINLIDPIRSPSASIDGQILSEDPILCEDTDFSTSNYDALEYSQVMIGKSHNYSFDKIFSPICSQQHIYTCSVLPLIEKFMDGYNATVFAYGQTGSGKTFTMGTGMEEGGMMECAESLGIIPRAIEDIFTRLQRVFSSSDSYQIYVSFLEIYNEIIKDLLSPTNATTATTRQLQIREDSTGEIYLAGCVEERIRSPHELFECLRKGSLCRSTASTDMNLTSSRSHAIFSVILRQAKDEGGQQMVSKFHFVDLAGSERLKKTNASGNRAKEAISINGGLLALGNVISALSSGRRNSHIPYRDSKLTRLLQNALGGNSQTLMLACVSPAEGNANETLNTLQYANRAKNIRNRVSVNVDANGTQFENAQLKKLVMALKQELLSLKSSMGVGALHGSGDSSVSYHGEQLALLKTQKAYVDKKVAELISQNSELCIKLELANSLKSGTLDDVMNSTVILTLKDQIVNLRSQLVIAESAKSGMTAATHVSSIVSDELLATLSPEELASRLARCQAELLEKMDLQAKYDRIREEYSVVKGKYEEKIVFLNSSIANLKKERDIIISSRKSVGINASASAGMSKFSRDKYEEKIKSLLREKETIKATHDELVLSLKGKPAMDSNIMSLKQIIGNLKHEKNRYIQGMTEEMNKLRALMTSKDAELKELKMKEKEASEDAKRFKKYYEYQKSLTYKKSILVSRENASNASSQATRETTSNGKEKALVGSPLTEASTDMPSSASGSMEQLSGTSIDSTNNSHCSILKRRKSDHNSSVITSQSLDPDDPMDVDASCSNDGTNVYRNSICPLSPEDIETLKANIDQELSQLKHAANLSQEFLADKLGSLTFVDSTNLLKLYIAERAGGTSPRPASRVNTASPFNDSKDEMPISPAFKSTALMSPTRKNAFIFSRSDIVSK